MEETRNKIWCSFPTCNNFYNKYTTVYSIEFEKRYLYTYIEKPINPSERERIEANDFSLSSSYPIKISTGDLNITIEKR
jgi:hypothetical protein